MHRVFAAAMCAALLSFSAQASSFDDFNQGIEAHNRGDNDTAIKAFTRALAAGDLTSNLKPVALIDRGDSYYREKRYADAIADFTAALALDPGRFDATYGRMLAYDNNAQGQLAAAECDSLIKMRPKFADIFAACGIISWENGEFAKAIPYFETAVNLSTKPPVYIDLWLEITRLRAGAPDEAEFAALTKKLGLDEWPQPIFDLYLGKTTPDAVLAAAEKEDEQLTVSKILHQYDKAASLRRQRCEAAFFVGEWLFLNRNIAQARALLGETNTYCENFLAPQKELARLPQK